MKENLIAQQVKWSGQSRTSWTGGCATHHFHNRPQGTRECSGKVHIRGKTAAEGWQLRASNDCLTSWRTIVAINRWSGDCHLWLNGLLPRKSNHTRQWIVERGPMIFYERPNSWTHKQVNIKPSRKQVRKGRKCASLLQPRKVEQNVETRTKSRSSDGGCPLGLKC